MEKQKPNRGEKQESGISFNAQSRSKQASNNSTAIEQKEKVVMNRTTKIP